MSEPIALRHGRVSLALHELRGGAGRKLLCLHALGATSESWREASRAWPGPVFALDFSGHGRSGRVRGGGYTPELLAGDADAALAHLGDAALAGVGIGAYVALLLAGTRPEHVPAALLLAGDGLAGGGALPDPDRDRGGAFPPPEFHPADADPFVAACGIDLRPIDYARAFAERARRLVLADLGADAPPWWVAAAECAAVERLPERTPATALAALART
ncbi:MAG TPA: alpha/beta fold hydrolase [Myxococcota bacterium]|nr:alpha/beta fold hydrolase [Myxococcota bacterium]